MTKEDWDYIGANWGSEDPVIMEKIGQMRDKNDLEFTNLQKDLADRNKTIDELTRQNIGLNQTNMQLVLRLTDPGMAVHEDKEPEYVAPAIDDYDAFWHA